VLPLIHVLLHVALGDPRLPKSTKACGVPLKDGDPCKANSRPCVPLKDDGPREANLWTAYHKSTKASSVPLKDDGPRKANSRTCVPLKDDGSREANFRKANSRRVPLKDDGPREANLRTFYHKSTKASGVPLKDDGQANSRTCVPLQDDGPREANLRTFYLSSRNRFFHDMLCRRIESDDVLRRQGSPQSSPAETDSFTTCSVDESNLTACSAVRGDPNRSTSPVELRVNTPTRNVGESELTKNPQKPVVSLSRMTVPVKQTYGRSTPPVETDSFTTCYVDESNFDGVGCH